MKETLEKTVSTKNYKGVEFTTKFTLNVGESDTEVLEQWILASAIIEWQRGARKLDKIPDKVIYTGRKDKAKDPMTVVSMLTVEQKEELLRMLIKDLGIEPEKKEE